MDGNGHDVPMDVALQMEYERGRSDAWREIDALGGPLGAAYEKGVQDERRRAIAARGELSATWQRRAVRIHEEVVAERAASMGTPVPVRQDPTGLWPRVRIPGEPA